MYNKLRICKNSIRKKYKSIRKNLGDDTRNIYSNIIYESLVESEFYKKAEMIFAYVSIGDEVDTYRIIQHAINNGKKVAVPYCVPNSCKMEFYFIENIAQLKVGAFGVPEPDPKKCEPAYEKNAIMLMPALAFDLRGYRMGYGKGYYDRYVVGFNGLKIGLCYSTNISKCILHNQYDCCADYIITDKFTKFIAK